MPFANNNQNVPGDALTANASGSARIPLLPYTIRTNTRGGTILHEQDLTNYRNNGAPLVISGTHGGSAACIHVASLSALDEVYLWASNRGTTAAQLTISFVTGALMVGTYIRDYVSATNAIIEDSLSSRNPQRRIVTTVSPQAGMQLVYPGIPHTNRDSLFAVASNKNMSISGFVMRRFPEVARDPAQGFDGQE